MPNFDRGFKTWADNISVSIRKELGLNPHDPLPIASLAEYLKIELFSPDDILGIPQENLKQLLEKDPSGWSATTFHIGNRTVIINNPKHSKKRQASDVMHEFAHVLCHHELAKIIISMDGKIEMKSFDKKQEDEAGWLSGCLLLPRAALLHIKFKRIDDETASNLYCVTNDMLRYRVNVSGVNYVMSRMKNYSRK